MDGNSSLLGDETCVNCLVEKGSPHPTDLLLSLKFHEHTSIRTYFLGWVDEVCEGLVLPTLCPPQLWKGRSDPVLHIELRRWADLMVVAPLDANTLAKVANGICDNLLVSTQALPAAATTPQHCLTLSPWNLGASAASSAPPSSACLSPPQHSSPSPSLPFPLLSSDSLSPHFPVLALCLPFFWSMDFLVPPSSLSVTCTHKHMLTHF